jgi:hypothetical protein
MDIKKLWAILLGVLYVALILYLITPAPALADKIKTQPMTYLVMPYNDQVRIVLSKEKCPSAGYKAVAQRIDKQYLRGCWSPDEAKQVRIKWEGGDFSLFDMNRFEPVEIQ